MKPDPICDVLPGRTTAEDDALELSRKAVERANREADKLAHKRLSTSLTWAERQVEAKLRAMPAKMSAIAEAERVFRAKAEELAELRRKLLPDEAENVQLTVNGDAHGDTRYLVTCVSRGRVVSLGGCTTRGPAQDRQRWFERELAARRAA